MDNPQTRNRRIRLNELITSAFNNKQKDLLGFILEKSGTRANQGELSGLCEYDGKSFGAKKAVTLCKQIGMHHLWFELPPGTNLDPSEWEKDPVGQQRNGVKEPAQIDVEKPPRSNLPKEIQEVVDLMLSMTQDGRTILLSVARSTYDIHKADGVG